MSDALFSGWGVRTLSTDDAGFNPIGYHRGASDGARCGDPIGMDLESNHPDVGADEPKAGGQFQGGHRQRAVAEVDDEGVGRGEQCGPDAGGVHQPAVAAA